MAGDPEATPARHRPFVDRCDAGRYLATFLERYRGKGTVVLGIPRGGVPVAGEVARQLDADLDIVVARKVGEPFQPELALGAVTANGGQYLNEDLIVEVAVSRQELNAAIAREQEVARQSEAHFRSGRPPVAIAGRTVIIVDDGLATGATMRAAARSVRRHGAARLVVAVPVGARETCLALAADADAVVCPWQPEPFYAVGLWYQRFAPTNDAEVLRILDAFQPVQTVADQGRP
jgi:putative phosphoribosyl transferase